MRTPNSECVICGKPLYRRPNELAKVRHVACMAHRAEAQRREGQTDKQIAALSLGRAKGTNHLTGIAKSESSKRKRSVSMAAWCTLNPEGVAARSMKVRGAKHYRWNGGTSKLNDSIRRMTENRKWMDAVKSRDGKCLRCGSIEELESHHKIPLATLIERFAITNRADARTHASILWDVTSGETLCQRCHYGEHERTYREDRRSDVRAVA